MAAAIVAAPKDLWLKQRIAYESNPSVTYSDCARELGISRAAVQKRAKAEGWRKLENSIQLAQKALAEADRLEAEAKSNPVEDAEVRKAVARSAVDVRAKVIEAHRREIEYVTHQLLYPSIKAKDFELARLAKISFESMRIKHDLQRRAYGLDVAEDKSDQVKIVISREEVT